MRARYALCLMLEVAQRGASGKPVPLAEVADKTGVSRKFLEQVAASLKSHDMLRGRCGRRGGYTLARQADQISVRQVVEAATGPIDLCVGAEDCGFCLRRDFCHCHLVWALLNQRVLDVFDHFTLADLTRQHTMRGIREALAAVGGPA